MKTVALTGSTGFLGTHCVEALAGKAHLRLLTRSPRRDCDGITHITGTLETAEALGRLVDGADCIVHIAGAVRSMDRAGFMRVNRDGTARLLEAARRHAPDARFVHISSLAARMPTLSAYAGSKAAAERLAAGQGAVIVRPPGIYGPGDLEILKLIRAARRGILPVPGNRGNRVSLIYGPDLARLIADLALAGMVPAGIHEVDDGKPSGYSYDELATILSAVLGRTVRPLVIPRPILMGAGHLSDFMSRLGGQANIFGAGKARELLHPDWVPDMAHQHLASLRAPSVRFPEGLREAIIWAQSRGYLP